jgi:release factor glutamine methyltransferase
LMPGGRLLLEIGPTQAGSVSAYLTAQGFVDVALTHDLDGRDRVVSAIKP